MLAGFADTVHDAQATFRAVLDALARPGLPQRLSVALAPPEPLTPELASVALALADADTALWLDEVLDTPDVARWLRFHTGAPLTDDPAKAAFALVRDPARCRPLDAFAQGTPAYPDTSTTLIVAFASFDTSTALRLAGPGIRGETPLALSPLPTDWPAQLAANHARFPLGVDLILTTPGFVTGLPRSTTVSEG